MTTIGLFQSYAPPGVYTRTLLDRAAVNLLGGLRIPVLVGPADEVKTVYDEELFRGSSSTADNPVYNEDVSSQFDGTNRTFTVARYPIVDGSGNGTITNDPNNVEVTVDGVPSVIVQVTGLTGEVQLQSIPIAGSVVKVSYFFKRTDTLIEDEDVSAQFGITPVSSNTFKTIHRPIVDGSNGGVPTTDPADVTVTVDGVEVEVESVDGANGSVTLTLIPAVGTTVLVTYYFNQYRDTSDSLQNTGVTRVLRVGTAPGRLDYTEGVDFVVFQDEVHWGQVAKVATGTTSVGTVPLSSTQVMTTLADDRVYFRPVTGSVNSVNRTYTLEHVPVDGTGEGETTNDPSKVLVYVGVDLPTAKAAGPVTIAQLTGSTRTMILEDAPPTGETVFATYWRNRLPDNIFTITSTVKGGAGVGKYTIADQNNAKDLALVTEGIHSVTDGDFGTEGITWPNAQADFLTSPSNAVDETVTVTFGVDGRSYTVTSSVIGGSAGTGQLDQTYIDAVTGLTFTVQEGITVTYINGDFLTFIVQLPGEFTAGSSSQRAVPGIRLVVLDLVGVVPGNTATVQTFLASGEEPDIGDFYYVSYEYTKTDFSTQVFADFNDVKTEHGSLRVDNKLVLGAYLAFLNGAVAVGLKPIQKATGSTDGTSEDYIEAFKELETSFGAGFSADIIVPLNTSTTVHSALRKHVDTQSTARYQNERTAVVGVASGTTPAQIMTMAQGYKSRRFVMLYPDTVVILLQDASGVTEVESILDGSFMAAAFAGLRASPQYDVAEPMTRKRIVGFQRLGRQLTEPDKNQVAQAGVTVLQEAGTELQIRHALTTDMSSVLTREYNVTTANDLVQQLTRRVLDPFIGTKFLRGEESTVESAVGSMLMSLVNANIISEYTGIKATSDAVDPTVLRVSYVYRPIFAVNWIEVTIQLRSRLDQAA